MGVTVSVVMGYRHFREGCRPDTCQPRAKRSEALGHRTKNMNKTEKYTSLLPQVQAVMDEKADIIANMANMAAMLHETFGFWWTGFYRVIGGELVLGPFQGPRGKSGGPSSSPTWSSFPGTSPARRPPAAKSWCPSSKTAKSPPSSTSTATGWGLLMRPTPSALSGWLEG